MRTIVASISMIVAISLGGCHATPNSQAFQALSIKPETPAPMGLIPPVR